MEPLEVGLPAALAAVLEATWGDMRGQHHAPGVSRWCRPLGWRHDDYDTVSLPGDLDPVPCGRDERLRRASACLSGRQPGRLGEVHVSSRGGSNRPGRAAARSTRSNAEGGSKPTGRYTAPKQRPPAPARAAVTDQPVPPSAPPPTRPSASPSTNEPRANPGGAGAPGRLDILLDRLAPELLGVTYWFRPSPGATSVTVRFSGRRLEVTGALGAGDRFVHDQTVEGIVPGSGPVAVTARVHDVNPGDWAVAAKLLPDHGHRLRGGEGGATLEVRRAGWSWRRWRLLSGVDTPVKTCLAPYVRVPGLLVGSWALLATLGVAAALVVQLAVISAARARLHGVLAISVPAVAGGVVGAKAWFMVLHRRDCRREGWCIQGLVVGVSLVAAALLAVTGSSVRVFLDVTAPALMFGLAVGRVGCFFTGCCAGRPTASRWGVWSSNRDLGVRRVPTQLLESGLAAVVGAGSLVGVLEVGAGRGGVFLSALGGYTLVRQALLRLREERRKSVLAGPATAAVAAVMLAAGIVLAATS